MDQAHAREIEADELRCHVAEHGFDAIAVQLAMTSGELRAALRGRWSLPPDRVLALRDGVDLRVFERVQA